MTGRTERVVVVDDSITVEIVLYDRDGEVARVIITPQRALGLAADLIAAVRRRSGPDIG